VNAARRRRMKRWVDAGIVVSVVVCWENERPGILRGRGTEAHMYCPCFFILGGGRYARLMHKWCCPG
jgi:hypothetical protein